MHIYIFHYVRAVKLAMCNIFFSFLLLFPLPSILVEFHRNIFRLIFPRRGGEKREREEKGFFPLICRNCSLRYAAGCDIKLKERCVNLLNIYIYIHTRNVNDEVNKVERQV